MPSIAHPWFQHCLRQDPGSQHQNTHTIWHWLAANSIPKKNGDGNRKVKESEHLKACLTKELFTWLRKLVAALAFYCKNGSARVRRTELFNKRTSTLPKLRKPVLGGIMRTTTMETTKGKVESQRVQKFFIRAGTEVCVQTSIQSISLASLAWLGNRPSRPLRLKSWEKQKTLGYRGGHTQNADIGALGVLTNHLKSLRTKGKKARKEIAKEREKDRCSDKAH